MDQIIPEGMEYGTQILVSGDTGVGKTVLAGQFLVEGLLCGDTCIYVACDEAPAVMRRHLRDYKVGVMAYENAEQLILVDAYEEEESSEKYFIANQYSLEKYAVMERLLLQRFSGRRLRLVRQLEHSADPFYTGRDLVSRNRLKFLRKSGVLTMDIMVDGVLDQRLMTIAGHLYNVTVRMKFGGSEGGG